MSANSNSRIFSTMNNLINEINLRRGVMKLPGSRLLVILCSVALFCSAGCGEGAPSDTPELGSVTGTVTMDGKPLANVTVTFEPETGKPRLEEPMQRDITTSSTVKTKTGPRLVCIQSVSQPRPKDLKTKEKIRFLLNTTQNRL